MKTRKRSPGAEWIGPVSARADNFGTELAALRGGGLGFDAFARRNADRFRKWAGYYFERWPQRMLDVGDLTQEGLTAAWHAVDRWDPSRGVTLERYVTYQVGARMKQELERVLGWPDKRRGFRAVRPESMPGHWTGTERRDHGSVRRLPSSLVVDPFEVVEVVEAATIAIEETGDTLAGEVVAAVGAGATAQAIAFRLWANDDARARYGFASPAQTMRRVRAAIKQSTEALGAVH